MKLIFSQHVLCLNVKKVLFTCWDGLITGTSSKYFQFILIWSYNRQNVHVHFLISCSCWFDGFTDEWCNMSPDVELLLLHIKSIQLLMFVAEVRAYSDCSSKNESTDQDCRHFPSADEFWKLLDENLHWNQTQLTIILFKNSLRVIDCL